ATFLVAVFATGAALLAALLAAGAFLAGAFFAAVAAGAFFAAGGADLGVIFLALGLLSMVLATFFFAAVAGARAGLGVGLAAALLAAGDLAAAFLPAVFNT